MNGHTPELLKNSEADSTNIFSLWVETNGVKNFISETNLPAIEKMFLNSIHLCTHPTILWNTFMNLDELD